MYYLIFHNNNIVVISPPKPAITAPIIVGPRFPPPMSSVRTAHPLLLSSFHPPPTAVTAPPLVMNPFLAVPTNKQR